MTEYQARLANLIGPRPECGNGRLSAVVDDEGTTNLLCRDCGSCWHAEFEWSRRVDRAACPGCAAREICETVHRGATVVPQTQLSRSEGTFDPSRRVGGEHRPRLFP